MFNKKDKKEEVREVKEVKEVKEKEVVVHFNPHQDPLCAGCGKPCLNPTSKNEKGVYHDPSCFNMVNPPQ